MSTPGADRRVAVVMITHNRREEVLRSLGHLTSLPERSYLESRAARLRDAR